MSTELRLVLVSGRQIGRKQRHELSRLIIPAIHSPSSRYDEVRNSRRKPTATTTQRTFFSHHKQDEQNQRNKDQNDGRNKEDVTRLIKSRLTEMNEFNNGNGKETTQNSTKHVLAVMNYARLKAPLDDLSMREFAKALEPINDIAKSTPGFVWSFDNGIDDIDDVQRNEVDLLRNDPLLMPQLSCWANMESLRHFVYKSGHAIYYKRKREWFESPAPSPYMVCWWHNLQQHNFQPPTLKEAFDRCHFLKENGPSFYAFDFATAKHYPLPSETSNRATSPSALSS